MIIQHYSDAIADYQFDLNQCKLQVATYYSKCCCGLYVVISHNNKVFSLVADNRENLQVILKSLENELYQLPIEWVEYSQAQAIAKGESNRGSLGLFAQNDDRPIRLVAYTDVKSAQCAVTKDAMLDDIYQQFKTLLSSAITVINKD